jgi:hypothetical protein
MDPLLFLAFLPLIRLGCVFGSAQHLFGQPLIYALPVPFKLIEEQTVAYGGCSPPGQDHEVCRRAITRFTVVRPEAFPDNPFKPVSLHCPFIDLAGNRHSQTGLRVI